VIPKRLIFGAETREGAVARLGRFIHQSMFAATLVIFLVWAGCTTTVAVAGALSCDESIKSGFKPDANTTVRLVKSFKKGDDLNLDGTASGKLAANDLCMVKLNVGPGNPGPADAASTSRGIGIEIWLPSPAVWNGRIHVLGGGGYSGDPQVSSLTKLGRAGSMTQAYEISGTEGSVSAVTDAGHVSQGKPMAGEGAFLMLPDGHINRTLWKDFSSRAVHEMAVKARALAEAYYGDAPKYSYFEGCSTGGRQGQMEAQEYPNDFDGILVGDGAIEWTHFTIAEMYLQLVMQRDLDGALLSSAQLDLVSSAAVSACDTDLNGQHAGYISDPAACRYDPTKDRAVQCKADGGSNETAACLSRKQATVVNKMWFGPTLDGSVPDPATANGYTNKLLPKQIWFGLPRGTQLATMSFFGIPGLAGSLNGIPNAFMSDQLALTLQKSSLAAPEFRNATGNGTDGWKTLSYADLGRAQKEGVALQSAFADINTDNPDLSRFRNRKGKMVYYYGMADQLIPIQGSTKYYSTAAEKMGGYSALQKFYRYYQIPGMGHCYAPGSVNGIAGISPPADPPLPAPTQLYTALVDWVEKGKAPENLVLRNSKGSIARPLCMYPAKLAYSGGAVASATSYSCRVPDPQ
jgi:Tannase and feruloyl esterase